MITTQSTFNQIINDSNIIPVPAILGLITASIFFLSRLDKTQEILEQLKQKDEKGILLPSFIFLITPFLFTFLFGSINIKEIENFLKSILPVITFLWGSSFERNQKQENLRHQESELIQKLIHELLRNNELAKRHKEEIEKDEQLGLFRKKFKELSNLSSIEEDFLRLKSIQTIIKEKYKANTESRVKLNNSFSNINDVIEKFNSSNKEYRHLIKKYNKTLENEKGNKLHPDLVEIEWKLEKRQRDLKDDFLEYIQNIFKDIFLADFQFLNKSN